MSADPARRGGAREPGGLVDDGRLWSICAFAFGQNQSNVDVVHAGLLEGKPHELAAPWVVVRARPRCRAGRSASF